MNKTCSKCNIDKPTSDFHKDKQKVDGFFPSCKECRKGITKKYYENNSEKIREKTGKYYQNNKETIIKKGNEYKKRMRKSSRIVLLRRRLRNRLYYALRKTTWKKDTHFSDYIGCTKEELVSHIVSLFTKDMNWEQMLLGNIHIDHIIPLSSASTEEGLYKLCHYTNLQPLWAADNIKKGSLVAPS